MGPLENFLGKDSDKLVKPLVEQEIAEGKTDFFREVESEIAGMEEIIAEGRTLPVTTLDRATLLLSEFEKKGWQASGNSIETQDRKGLYDRLKKLVGNQ